MFFTLWSTALKKKLLLLPHSSTYVKEDLKFSPFRHISSNILKKNHISSLKSKSKRKTLWAKDSSKTIVTSHQILPLQYRIKPRWQQDQNKVNREINK